MTPQINKRTYKLACTQDTFEDLQRFNTLLVYPAKPTITSEWLLTVSGFIELGSIFTINTVIITQHPLTIFIKKQRASTAVA